MDIKPNFIHRSDNTNLNEYIYTKVYSTKLTTIVLNNEIIEVPPSLVLPIIVRNISGNTDTYCLGNKKNVFTGSESLGGGQFL